MSWWGGGAVLLLVHSGKMRDTAKLELYALQGHTVNELTVYSIINEFLRDQLVSIHASVHTCILGAHQNIPKIFA